MGPSIECTVKQLPTTPGLRQAIIKTCKQIELQECHETVNSTVTRPFALLLTHFPSPTHYLSARIATALSCGEAHAELVLFFNPADGFHVLGQCLS
jgi:hypothetical protein